MVAQGLLLFRTQGRFCRNARNLAPSQDDNKTHKDNQKRRCPENGGAGRQSRLQQDKLTVARHDEIPDLCIAVALGQVLADENAQVLCERRVGFINGLILADEAAKTCREIAGALFQFRIAKNFVGLHGVCWNRE